MYSISADPLPAPPVAGTGEPIVRRILRTIPVLQIATVFILFVVTIISIDGFFNRTSIYSVLILASFLGISAAGQTVVILIGALDLSVAALISGANLVCTLLIGRHWPIAGVLALVLCLSLAVGAMNGFIAYRFNVPPLIVTLATGAMVTGATLWWTNAGQVSGQVPAWLSDVSSPIGKSFGIPVPPVVVLWVLIAMVLSFVLHLSATGHRTYATGANFRAAELAGVKTRRIWIGAFALSAVTSATVGILLTGFTGAGDAAVGTPYQFLAITAVLVGGTSLVGARGDYWRTLLGTLILTLTTTLLVGHGVGDAMQEVLFGLLILAFVGVYGRDKGLAERV